jgi:hypothetical protein
MEPTSEQQAPEMTPANPEPALLSEDRGPPGPPQELESGAVAPRSDEETAPAYGEF